MGRQTNSMPGWMKKQFELVDQRIQSWSWAKWQWANEKPKSFERQRGESMQYAKGKDLTRIAELYGLKRRFYEIPRIFDFLFRKRILKQLDEPETFVNSETDFVFKGRK